jgi:DMSO reductase family type II enzyme chaperone
MITQMEVALCRSAIYEALALGFQPPSAGTAARLLDVENNHALAELAAVAEYPRSSGLESLKSLVLKLAESAVENNLAILENVYRRLFGHTAHAQVPPYETEYGAETLFQQPQQLADLTGFYQAFGLSVNTSAHERVDHISCECEYMSFLTRKEAYALEQNDAEMLAEVCRAQKLFLRDHLGRFVPAFANLLLRENGTRFYGALGNLCREFVLQECARFSVPAGPEHLRLRPTEAADDCFTCGGGDQVIRDLCDSTPACGILEGGDRLIQLSAKSQ